MKKLFFSALMCFMTLSLSAQYVDLGLPSGTKWKTTNEPGYYTYDQAKSQSFSHLIPTKAQWEELLDYGEWTWTGRGYKVVGPNGRSIFLPADGCMYDDGTKDHVGTSGEYLSSELSNPKGVWTLLINHSEKDLWYKGRLNIAYSTRLVQ